MKAYKRSGWAIQYSRRASHVVDVILHAGSVAITPESHLGNPAASSAYNVIGQSAEICVLALNCKNESMILVCDQGLFRLPMLPRASHAHSTGGGPTCSAANSNSLVVSWSVRALSQCPMCSPSKPLSKGQPRHWGGIVQWPPSHRPFGSWQCALAPLMASDGEFRALERLKPFHSSCHHEIKELVRELWLPDQSRSWIRRSR